MERINFQFFVLSGTGGDCVGFRVTDLGEDDGLLSGTGQFVAKIINMDLVATVELWINPVGNV